MMRVCLLCGRLISTCVDKVVGVVVVADGTGLRLVELGVLDFF